ncbi:hypothetical protein NQ023_07735 [Corynebacterium phoceense]|uniref:hypothetical protein n=1 Tax=Corynebacterium phoceense TaxID=1686286 RepID=UPI00211B94B8|nr:hypothetical protein [Corynebacterium phoceense]MCQ9331296.1 hypothetical protein [Corynebacterium phoceense]MCQ9348357.1 hypothetical protein [Corynebacterium phoceense]
MTRPEHPENDLDSLLDSMNKQPPEPHTFDELADAPDPLKLARASRRSTRQAIIFPLLIVAVSLLIGLGSLPIIRSFGGPLCSTGEADWLCTDTARWIWMPLAMLTPTIGMVGSGVIMMRKLNGYVRWFVWMGTFWFCALHFMLWGIDVLQVFLNAQNL